MQRSKTFCIKSEDVYTLFQSIWCHKLLFFGSIEDWVLFRSTTEIPTLSLEFCAIYCVYLLCLERYHPIYPFSRGEDIFLNGVKCILYCILHNLMLHDVSWKGSIYFMLLFSFKKKVYPCSNKKWDSNWHLYRVCGYHLCSRFHLWKLKFEVSSTHISFVF